MTHAHLISLWPSLSAFAEDIGVSYNTAKAMRRRGSVPAEYWTLMVSAAAERGLDGVTLDRLAEIVAVQTKAVTE